MSPGSTSTPVSSRSRARRAPANVTFVTGDAYRTGLTRGSTSCTCASSPAPPAIRSASWPRPCASPVPAAGIALQEADGSTLNCFPPDPAWSTAQARVARQLSRGRGRPAGAPPVPAAPPRWTRRRGVPSFRSSGSGPGTRGATICRRPWNRFVAGVSSAGSSPRRTSLRRWRPAAPTSPIPRRCSPGLPWSRPGAAFQRCIDPAAGAAPFRQTPSMTTPPVPPSSQERRWTAPVVVPVAVPVFFAAQPAARAAARQTIRAVQASGFFFLSCGSVHSGDGRRGSRALRHALGFRGGPGVTASASTPASSTRRAPGASPQVEQENSPHGSGSAAVLVVRSGPVRPTLRSSP